MRLQFSKAMNVALLLYLALALTTGALAQPVAAPTAQAPGRSDPSFTEPSLAPGVDYTVPTEAEIKGTLDRVLAHFVRSTRYRVLDSQTGKSVEDFSRPVKTAEIDLGSGEFNDWTYSTGVALAAMLRVSDVTSDQRYRDYALKNFDFIFDHLDYFRRQASQFGPQPRGFRRLLDMRELDDCGAMGAALIKAYAKKQDPRYRDTIHLAAEFISHKMMRMPDGTLARPRPLPVSIWTDDMYMSVPFLAQMGQLTGERKYFDDAARQVIQMSARVLNPANGLYDHAWFQGVEPDPRFYWGRADGWALMAVAELLSVMPEDHPDRSRVLEIFRTAVRGAAEVQGSTGLWHQLLDRPDSYLETSASAMFAFAIARGVNRGWISPAYGPVAQSGWQAVAKRVRDNGEIDGICVGTTAAYDAVYYYNRPTSTRAMQGYGPTLMAGAEMIEMLRLFDVERKLNTFHYRPRKK
jgi:unsaturated rhamnogalacturonyl hydrolase